MATYRKVVLANEQIYHIYNRGVERRTIFTSKRDFQRAINTLRYYRFSNLPLKFSKYLIQKDEIQKEMSENFNKEENQLVELISYCLIPNHFHFLVKQVKKNGIFKLLSNFSNSYVKYFNTRHERVGPLLQGIFKAVLIETDEQLIHVSRYIHLNPITSFIVNEQDLENYQWSSYTEYLGLKRDGFCTKNYVLDQFKSLKEYKLFVLDRISYAKELGKVKHLLLE